MRKCCHVIILKVLTPVIIRENEHDYDVIEEELLNFNGKLIRHDPDKIRDLLSKYLKKD